MNKFVFLRVISILGLAALLANCSAESRNARIKEKANEYFESGDYDRAKIEYLSLLKADNQNAAAIQQLGFIWFEQGAPLRAFPFLLKSRELSPDNLDLRIKLAGVLRVLGRIDEARQELAEILGKDPANENAILMLADTARTDEDISATKAELQKLKDSAPAACYLASATLAAREGDLMTAEDAVRQALDLDPDSVEAHLANARLLALRNSRVQAAQEFEKAAALSPVRSVARLKLAEFKAQSGEVEDAGKVLKEITEKAPDFLPAWGLRAQIELSEKKYDAALATLQNVFGRDPMNYDARRLEAQVLLASGKSTKALEALKRLDETYPRVSLTKFLLARASLLSGNPAQAMVALEEAIEINPNYMEAILLLAELKLRKGDANSVVTAMREVLQKRPNVLQAQLLLAEAYRATGNLSESAALLRKRITASPKLAQPHLLLGLVLRQQQKPEEARREFERVRELAPDDLSALYQLTDLDIAKGDFDAALERVHQQIRRTPEIAGTYFLEGRIYTAQKQWEKAEASLRKALEIDVNFTSAYNLLVRIYVGNNRLAEAASQLEALLAEQPDNVRARLTLALAYEKLNEFSRAIEAYEKVLVANPGSTVAMNNLAWLFATELNDLDRAYELATKARALQSGDAAVADTLGWTLYRRGDYNQALTLLQESVEKLPENPEVQLHWGMANYMMGRVETARTALKKAAEASAEFPGKEEARRRLAVLGEAGSGSAPLTVEEIAKVLEENPDDPVAGLRLGEAYEREGALKKAEEAYESALRVNPQLTAATIALAKLYSGPLQDREKALFYAKKSREIAPSDPHVAGLLGRVAFLGGNFTWSYSLLQESKRQLPEDVGILYNFAWAAYSLGKVDEAQEEMREISNSFGDSPQARGAESFLKMTSLIENPENLVKAEPELEKLLAADSNYVPALMACARLQEQRNEFKTAAATYAAVLEIYPDFAAAQKRLAALYVEDPEKRSKAYELAAEARKVLPQDQELAAILAQISYHRKDYSYAVQLMRESATKRALDAKDLFYLGMAHFELKQMEQCKDALQRALDMGLQEPMATDAHRVLGELRQQGS